MNRKSSPMPDESPSPQLVREEKKSSTFIFGLGILVLTLVIIGFSGFRYWQQTSDVVVQAPEPVAEIPETEQERQARLRAEMIVLMEENAPPPATPEQVAEMRALMLEQNPEAAGISSNAPMQPADRALIEQMRVQQQVITEAGITMPDVVDSNLDVQLPTTLPTPQETSEVLDIPVMDPSLVEVSPSISFPTNPENLPTSAETAIALPDTVAPESEQIPLPDPQN